MGLFDRIFPGGKAKVVDPAGLRSRIDRAMSGLQSLTPAHDGMWQIGQAAWKTILEWILAVAHWSADRDFAWLSGRRLPPHINSPASASRTS